MTSRPEPRTVEEKAREIYLSMFGAIVKPEDSLRLEILAAALREYGEEEFKRGCELFADGGYSHGNKEGYAQGFSDCKQKAIEIAGDHNGCVDVKCLSESNCGATIANQIHALTWSEERAK